MRYGLFQVGLISAFLWSPALLAQHTGPGVPAPISHMGVVGIRSPALSGASRSFAAPAANHSAQIGRTGHWPSWNGGGNGHPGNDQHRGPSRARYPYVYPGLLSFGYGLPVGYGYGPASPYDEGDVSPVAAPEQPPLAAGYGPQAPDPELAESAPPLYRPAYQGMDSVAPAQAPLLPQPATVLIFNDGRKQQQVHNYALTGTTLWALDGDTRQEIPLAEIDIPATMKANRAAGVDFALPTGR